MLFAGQKKTRRQLSVAAGDLKIVFARFRLSAQEHDRQPATSMVVMPMSIVAVICIKHRLGLYPTSKQLVKFLMVNPRNLSGREG